MNYDPVNDMGKPVIYRSRRYNITGMSGDKYIIFRRVNQHHKVIMKKISLKYLKEVKMGKEGSR